MKFIYSCDIHGDTIKYEKLHRLAIQNNINNLVLGGDLLPKKADLRAPIQRRFIREYFKEYLKSLKEDNIKFIGILGNDDLEIVEPEYKNMISNYDNVIDIDEEKVDIEGMSFIGLSKVLDTPFMRKDRIVVENGQEMPEQQKEIVYINKSQDAVTVEEWKKLRIDSVPKMEDVLEKLPNITENCKGIYIFHDPPYGIGLDNCKNGEIVGSKAIYNFINKNQPYMSFHGHIHESPRISGKWFEKIGNTVCIQPGQTEFGDSKLHYVIVDTDNNTYDLKFD